MSITSWHNKTFYGSCFNSTIGGRFFQLSIFTGPVQKANDWEVGFLPYRNLRFTGGLLRGSPLTIKSVKIKGVNLDFYTLQGLPR